MPLPRLLGIEIGGTKLQLGLGDGLGNLDVLERRRIEPANGAAGILAQIADGFRVLLDGAGLDSKGIAAAGIGFGGPIDLKRNRIERSFQVAGWENFPLGDWVCNHLGISKVALANDADSAGLAEARFGAGAGFSPLFYMTVGSGIGGALIVDNQIYLGSGRGAMEIGHLNVPADSHSKQPLRELEQVASGWGIAASARAEAERRRDSSEKDWLVLELASGNSAAITAELVAEAAVQGDAAALAILGQARIAVAFALTQMIVLNAPRRIVIGGGVSLIGEDHWFLPIRECVDQHVFAPFRGQFEIVPAALGEDVVIHGALAIARDLIA